MKKISGKKIKNKGKNGERELAKILENYFSSKFIRVPNSGSYTGGKNIYREKNLDRFQIKLMKGDIITPEKFHNIIFECKFYRDFSLRQCLKSKFSLLDKWIDQIEAILSNNELWFLCIKINNQGWLILFDKEHINHFFLESYINYVSDKEKEYILTDMKNFLDKNKERIEEISKKNIS